MIEILDLWFGYYLGFGFYNLDFIMYPHMESNHDQRLKRPLLYH